MTKRFKVHIDWFNYEKTEGAIELKDNGQPLLISESIDDVRYLKDLLNCLNDENEQLKKILGFLENDNAEDILNVLNSQENRIWELKQENEQLKQELQRMKKAEILANQRGELIGFATSLIEDLGSQEMQEMWTKFREKKYKEWRGRD